MECIHMKIVQSSLPAIDVLLVYRRDKVAFLTFIDEFSTLFERCVTGTGSLCLLGDFNIKMNRLEDSKSQTFREFLECFDLKNHINFPTHLSGNTLDLIISRLEDSYISNIKQGELLADHHAVEFRMQADVNFKEPITRTVRSMKKVDLTKLKSDFSTVMTQIMELDTLDDAVELYNVRLGEILNSHAPLRVKRLPDKPSPPWLSNELTDMIRERRRLERRWKASLSDDSRYHAFVLSRKNTAVAIKTAMATYYADLIQQNAKNTKELYKICNKMLGRKQETPLPEHSNATSLANDFKYYFTDKIDKIRVFIEGELELGHSEW